MPLVRFLNLIHRPYDMNAEKYSEDQLLSLDHNDHRAAFLKYLNNATFVKDKQDFLYSWIMPGKNDVVLECGSSSGKTCIDLSRRTGCYCLGVDFDPVAVEVANEMRDKYFPDLKDKCYFKVGDLSNMRFDKDTSKVVMADFTEHIPDAVFAKILANIKSQLPEVRLYIYTPARSHIFEIMKRNNLILKAKSGHINVKTEKNLVFFLKKNGWKITQIKWRPSHLPVFRNIELFLGHIPFVGIFFRRRIVIVATPDHAWP